MLSHQRLLGIAQIGLDCTHYEYDDDMQMFEDKLPWYLNMQAICLTYAVLVRPYEQRAKK